MNRLSNVLNNLRSIMSAYQQEHMRNNALAKAQGIMLQKYPDSSELCFDEHFFQNGAVGIAREFVEQGVMPSPHAISHAWVAQFFFTSGRREKALEFIMPRATDFVHVLETEIEAGFDTPSQVVNHFEVKHRKGLSV